VLNSPTPVVSRSPGSHTPTSAGPAPRSGEAELARWLADVSAETGLDLLPHLDVLLAEGLVFGLLRDVDDDDWAGLIRPVGPRLVLKHASRSLTAKAELESLVATQAQLWQSIALLEREDTEFQRRHDGLRDPIAQAASKAALAQRETTLQAQSFDANVGQFNQLAAVLQQQQGVPRLGARFGRCAPEPSSVEPHRMLVWLIGGIESRGGGAAFTFFPFLFVGDLFQIY